MTGSNQRAELLSLLWIFAMLNYLYADVIGLMDASLLRQYLAGRVDAIELTPGFFFAAAVLMELPIAMVVLSRLLPHRASRWSNVAAGALKTIVVFVTLFVGTPTAYYTLFAVIEMGCTALIVALALRWKPPGALRPAA
ncbi:MAG: hypothetical protein JNK82_32540 [Myxococcaceae bacterium]|nr:hypothetical protein [Myxococcaceae bacterium]